jgi:hypothetical protein
VTINGQMDMSSPLCANFVHCFKLFIITDEVENN